MFIDPDIGTLLVTVLIIVISLVLHQKLKYKFGLRAIVGTFAISILVCAFLFRWPDTVEERVAAITIGLIGIALIFIKPKKTMKHAS